MCKNLLIVFVSKYPKISVLLQLTAIKISFSQNKELKRVRRLKNWQTLKYYWSSIYPFIIHSVERQNLSIYILLKDIYIHVYICTYIYVSQLMDIKMHVLGVFSRKFNICAICVYMYYTRKYTYGTLHTYAYITYVYTHYTCIITYVYITYMYTYSIYIPYIHMEYVYIHTMCHSISS